jgi:hypothetical protein
LSYLTSSDGLIDAFEGFDPAAHRGSLTTFAEEGLFDGGQPQRGTMAQQMVKEVCIDISTTKESSPTGSSSTLTNAL